jgi:hypothetical protein
MEKKPQKSTNEEVLREFPAFGKYRIRLVHNPRKPSADPVLDIREYVNSETFEGFTRRGIRIQERAHMDLLRDVLQQVLEANGFAKPAPGMMPVS